MPKPAVRQLALRHNPVGPQFNRRPEPSTRTIPIDWLRNSLCSFSEGNHHDDCANRKAGGFCLGNPRPDDIGHATGNVPGSRQFGVQAATVDLSNCREPRKRTHPPARTGGGASRGLLGRYERARTTRPNAALFAADSRARRVAEPHSSHSISPANRPRSAFRRFVPASASCAASRRTARSSSCRYPSGECAISTATPSASWRTWHACGGICKRRSTLALNRKSSTSHCRSGGLSTSSAKRAAGSSSGSSRATLTTC